MHKLFHFKGAVNCKRQLTFFISFLFFGILIAQNSFQFDNYNTLDGLSDNYITSLHQDNNGWIWVGTSMGIERFDGIHFKTYPIVENDSLMINDFLVRNFFETKSGKMFVCAEEYGLALYNRDHDAFERVMINNRALLNDVSVKSIDEDSDGNLWIATKDGLKFWNLQTQSLEHYRNNRLNHNSISDNYVRKVVVDEHNNLWIATRSGLDLFFPKNNEFIHYSKYNSLLGEDILEIVLDHHDRLWVGTMSNGVFVVNGTSIEPLTILEQYDRSNKVNSIVLEDETQFWIGTRGGLFLYNDETKELISSQNNLSDKKSIAHNSIIDLIKDQKGDLWVATRGGLSNLVKDKQYFTNYTRRGDTDYSLNDGEIYAIWQDQNKNIWFGTEAGGVNIYNPQTDRYKYLTKENSGLSVNCIKAFEPVGKHQVLIGTFGGGLNIYDAKTNKVKTVSNPDSKLDRSIIWDIATDVKGRIWMGTVAGLDQFDFSSQTFVHYSELDGVDNGVTSVFIDSENDLWLGGNSLRIYRPGVGIINEFNENTEDVFMDSSGQIWVSTVYKGIAMYDKYKGAQKYINKNDGLPTNLAYCILEDQEQKLWISTARGLCCYNPKNNSFRNYYYHDGLHGNQFHYGAALKTDDGTMFFGGINGASSFIPGNMLVSDYVPPIYLTDFKVYNQSIQAGNSEYASMPKSISMTETIEVPYQSNMLTFEFASLNYTNSRFTRYKYLLEGFDKNWNEAEVGIQKATYTNLDPGEYTFKVVAGNELTYWDESVASVQLIVVPPFYMTNWFKTILILVILISVLALFYYILQKREQRKLVEFEKMKAHKLHELDAFKLKLFTNISHEIKTPLTLIISPLKKILKSGIENSELKENLKLMEKNASQLMSLVTQLLDYRKLQEGKLELELKKGDIIRFCKDTFELFTDLMEEKGIQGKFTSIQKELFCYFDPEKLKKILNNLLSNAIRYNKKEGTITFQFSLKLIDEKSFIQIDVVDSGIGMSESEIAQIFDRYYSKSNSEEYSSSGIGLAYTKELVELHKGQMKVETVHNEGSKFSIQIPLIEDEQTQNEEIKHKDIKAIEFIATKEFDEAQKNKKVVLLVEDNPDVRKFIQRSFGQNYLLLETNNGTEGLEIAVQAVPDIIISDVMMPGLNGMELTEKVKQDERTSHIPVILLSALSTNDKIKEGLQKGADDYMTKPFDVDILKTKVENLIQLQMNLIEKYGNQFNYEPKQELMKSHDDKFIEKLLKLIEDNIDNPDLNIEKFIDELSVSRMQLYRKTAAITGMTVKELVNDIRFKKAALLLKENKISISEIAYMVGFNDVSYFGKCFKKKYGVSPSSFVKDNS